jgi:hypothetical protein
MSKQVIQTPNNNLQENSENLATEKYVLEHYNKLKVDIEYIDNKIDVVNNNIIPKITNNENTWTNKNTFEDYVNFNKTIKTEHLEVNNNANLKKYSFESQIITFKEINEFDYIIEDKNNYNYRALKNVNSITLPMSCQDGQTIYIQNTSNNLITISSNTLMYHTILTPFDGSLKLIINPKITLCFVFNSLTNPFWSIIS